MPLYEMIKITMYRNPGTSGSSHPDGITALTPEHGSVSWEFLKRLCRMGFANYSLSELTFTLWLGDNPVTAVTYSIDEVGGTRGDIIRGTLTGKEAGRERPQRQGYKAGREFAPGRDSR